MVTFRLTHSHSDHEVIKVENPIDTQNPNFGSVVRFKNIKLPFEPLLWPLLVVNITDEGNVIGLGGCETCYTTITLFDFAQDILTDKEINFAKAQLNKN